MRLYIAHGEWLLVAESYLANPAKYVPWIGSQRFRRTHICQRVYSCQAAARSSLSAPRATIFMVLSGNGLCSALASSHGARIQTSRSSSVVRITGMALGWIGSTMAFGAVVRQP